MSYPYDFVKMYGRALCGALTLASLRDSGSCHQLTRDNALRHGRL